MVTRPVVNPAAAVAVVALVAAVAPHLRSGYGLVAAVTTVVGLAAAAVDLDVHRIPNALVLWGLAAVAVTVGVAGVIDGRLHAAVYGALVGAAGFAGPLLVAHLASPGGIGFGDVKLAVVLGAGLGAGNPVLGALGLLAACVAALARRLIVRRLRGAEPFAPAMAAGTALVLALARVAVVALGFHWFA